MRPRSTQIALTSYKQLSISDTVDTYDQGMFGVLIRTEQMLNLGRGVPIGPG